MNHNDLKELYDLENTSADTFGEGHLPPFNEWIKQYNTHCTNDVNEDYIEDTLNDVEFGDQYDDTLTDEPTEQVVQVVVVEEVKEPVVEEKTTEYKNRKEHAVAVYKSLMIDGEHPARKDVITAFVEEIGMSKAGASTYHYNVKKEI